MKRALVIATVVAVMALSVTGPAQAGRCVYNAGTNGTYCWIEGFDMWFYRDYDGWGVVIQR